MKKLLIIVFLFSSLQASGLKFLHQDVGARYGAMGSIGTVNVEDAFSLYWNPALINNLDKLQVGLSQGRWLAGDPHYFAGFLFPIRSWYMGISVNYSNVDQIQIREIPQVNPVGETEWEDWYVGISLMRYFSNKFSAGMTYKKIYQNIYDEKAGGYGLDIGANYLYSDKLNVAVVVKNIGQMDDLNKEATDLPLSIEAGGYYRDLMKLGNGTFNTGALWQFIKDAPDNQNLFKLGVEYAYDKMFFLRTGFIHGNDLLDYSLGMGLQKGVIKLDYTWKNAKNGFSDINMFSFHFLF